MRHKNYKAGHVNVKVLKSIKFDIETAILNKILILLGRLKKFVSKRKEHEMKVLFVSKELLSH